MSFIIVSDTFRYDYLGANGNAWIKTPERDAFARLAVNFDRCTISRSRAMHACQGDPIRYTECVRGEHFMPSKKQLSYTPEKETLNRKPLTQPAPFAATWEMRCGPGNQFRVFYKTVTAERTVRILAIGVKAGSRLFIGGEEFRL